MRTFNNLFKLSWTFLVAIFLMFGLAGCEGDDGAAGAAGATGAAGTNGTDGTDGTDGADGADGQACWDLDGNGVGDVGTEDLNGDGVVDVKDCGPGSDPVAAAIEMAAPESCAVCHEDAGEEHQAVYDKYVDESALGLTFDSVASVDNLDGTWTVTLNFSITKNGAPYVDTFNLSMLDQKRFYSARHTAATDEFLTAGQCSLSSFIAVDPANGLYAVSDNDCGYAPEDPANNAQVYGYIAQTPLFDHAGGTGAEAPAGTHVHLYDDVANTALAFGTASVDDVDAYVSAANPEGCEKCHGAPYLKHGYRAAQVDGLPDFAACKVCHLDDRNASHTEWQHMVDDPFSWATGVPETANYAFTRKLMNVTHMAHSMEFPYPQSMANCATCHAGKLDMALDNSNFTAQTCKSCHAVRGIDSAPKTFDELGNEILSSRGRSVPGKYYDGRAPSLQYLWSKNAGVNTTDDLGGFHTAPIASSSPTACTVCHDGGTFFGFADVHTGYDPTIYNADGDKYAELYTVSIDSVTREGNLLTVAFSSNNANIVPELLVSFYGWDTKHYIVNAHERDANSDRMEYVPESSGGGPEPFFTEDATSVPGNWLVTFDMAAPQPTKTDDIPTLIAEGVIKKVEFSLAPELELPDGTDAVLAAVSETFDLNADTLIADYFQGANGTVDVAKCNVCHDALASSFHDGSGRGGDGVQVCKNCHATTYPGSHVEMASRSIDNYVHAIHSFQEFDPGDVFEEFDPVFAKRYDQHIHHVFPNFTITNCEACHLEGKYNVPDQSKSLFGVASATDTVNTWYDIVDGLAVEDPDGRAIGELPELVMGPASRACGGCHRARLIRDDAAGDLVAWNAHTEAFGTLVENDADDAVVFGVIEKIMSYFR